MDAAWVNGRVAPRPGGEAAGLEALMDQYGGRVYRLALNITQNNGDAEEVVQDVFFAVFRKIDTFEGRSTIGSWLYRICRNTAINKRRGKRFALEISLEQLLQFHGGSVRAAKVACTVADWPQTPDQRLLTREARAVLNAALDALPDHYRAVVILRDVEGLRSADVAELLQESVPCVKARLHRARLILRARLASYFPHSVCRSSNTSDSS